jgi:hypothetical protein
MSDVILNQPITYEGKVIWNINTWNRNDKTYVTLGMLKSYANLFSINIFTSLNVFEAIQSKLINGVAGDIFEYLKNITSDVQEQFNSLFTKTTSISYFSENETTYIEKNLYCDNMGSNDIESQILNSVHINTQKVNSIDITTNTLQTKTLKANTITFNNDVGCFLIVKGFQMLPLMKSQVFNQVMENCYAHLKPNYFIVCKNQQGELLLSLLNSSDDFMYNIEIPQSVKSVELYLNGRKL